MRCEKRIECGGEMTEAEVTVEDNEQGTERTTTTVWECPSGHKHTKIVTVAIAPEPEEDPNA